MLLLNPGPVTLTPRVRAALTVEDMCHREPDFQSLQVDVRKRLIDVYLKTENYDSVLITGSGTAAVEAMLSTFVRAGDCPLVLANGIYGERMKKILTIQKKQHCSIDHEWTAPLDLVAVEKKLSEKKCTHAIAVHHETTTGRLNDIHELGKICKRYNVPLLLDAVSSFGGEEILFEEWNLLACAATANKCLHGAPGIAFVIARKNELTSTIPTGATSLYLDLMNHYKEQIKSGTAFTPATHICSALDEALKELQESGGWAARRTLFRERFSQLDSGLAKMGVPYFLKDANQYSCILKSYRLPAGLTYEQLHDRLRKSGFVIYAGQSQLKNEMFRISLMGALTNTDMDRLLTSIQSAIQGAI